ncbi:MAG: hypothetical protein KBT36_05370 [Kurthia sp.]|nr:hypothetical protein [Candidatus Kurthia equi]
MKIFSKVAALTLATSMVVSTFVVAQIDASAKEKIKTAKKTDSVKKNNKLMDKKTGKPVKGYATYEGKLYKNGVIFKGIVNGIKYSSGKKASTTINGIKYVAGKKATGVVNGQFYAGGKKATGITADGLLYVNGKVNKGDYVYKNVWYKGKTVDVEKNEAIASYKKAIGGLKEKDFTAENWATIQKMLAENTLDLTGKLNIDQLKTALQTINTTKEQAIQDQETAKKEQLEKEQKEKEQQQASQNTGNNSSSNNSSNSNSSTEPEVEISAALAKVIKGNDKANGIILTVRDYVDAGLIHVTEANLVDVKEGFSHARKIQNLKDAQIIVDDALRNGYASYYPDLVKEATEVGLQLINGEILIDKGEVTWLTVSALDLSLEKLETVYNALNERVIAKKAYDEALELAWQEGFNEDQEKQLKTVAELQSMTVEQLVTAREELNLIAASIPEEVEPDAEKDILDSSGDNEEPEPEITTGEE